MADLAAARIQEPAIRAEVAALVAVGDVHGAVGARHGRAEPLTARRPEDALVHERGVRDVDEVLDAVGDAVREPVLQAQAGPARLAVMRHGERRDRGRRIALHARVDEAVLLDRRIRWRTVRRHRVARDRGNRHHPTGTVVRPPVVGAGEQAAARHARRQRRITVQAAVAQHGGRAVRRAKAREPLAQYASRQHPVGRQLARLRHDVPVVIEGHRPILPVAARAARGRRRCSTGVRDRACARPRRRRGRIGRHCP